MTEQEKMQRGEWYDANYDAELLRQRQETDGICFDYNHTRPGDPRREDILRKLLKTEILPDGLEMLAPVYMDYGRNVHFGRHVFCNHGCYFMSTKRLLYGNGGTTMML